MDKRLPKEITENKWIRPCAEADSLCSLFIGAMG